MSVPYICGFSGSVIDLQKHQTSHSLSVTKKGNIR